MLQISYRLLVYIVFVRTREIFSWRMEPPLSSIVAVKVKIAPFERARTYDETSDET